MSIPARHSQRTLKPQTNNTTCCLAIGCMLGPCRPDSDIRALPFSSSTGSGKRAQAKKDTNQFESLQHICAHYRWGLTGTPPTRDLSQAQSAGHHSSAALDAVYSTFWFDMWIDSLRVKVNGLEYCILGMLATIIVTCTKTVWLTCPNEFMRVSAFQKAVK